MTMQFYATSVKHGSISNVTILTMWIINIYKIVISHGIASLVPIHFPFGIQKSMSVKNKLLKKFINNKDPQIKAECHEKYKKIQKPPLHITEGK